MTEDMINEMYLIAIKSKLQKGTISLEERVNCIIEELNSLSNQGFVTPTNIAPQQPANASDTYSAPVQVTAPAPVSTPAPVAAKDEIDVKYGQMPEVEGFDNRDLDYSPDTQYYKLEINNTTYQGTFSLLTEDRVAKEYMYSSGIAPSYAVQFENQPSSESNKLTVVKKGVIKKVKRFWEIVEPCCMKWT
jgi:hypothetical protein